MKPEREAFEVWKRISPVAAFSQGLGGCAGRLFLPTAANVKAALADIAAIKTQTKRRTVVAFLDSLSASLEFREPLDAPQEIVSAFMSHTLKEGINERHLASLASQSRELLAIEAARHGKRWPLEIRILTQNECAAAEGLLRSLVKETKSARLRREMLLLLKDIRAYARALGYPALKRGDFSEVYPLLRRGGGFGRKKIYPKLLRQLYGHPEPPKAIERKAMQWLEEELPKFREATRTVASIYGCRATAEDVTASLDRAHPVRDPLGFVRKTREELRPLIEDIVRIHPSHDVRVVETPRYLVNFFTTAAMMAFDTLTPRPYSVFFVTTSRRGSPSLSVPEAMQTIVHEEFGHAVNFTNTSANYGHRPALENLDSALSIPITEGIAFHRELEALRLFSSGAASDLVLELEFVVREWRLLRFLRAVGDVRLNTGRQSVRGFVEWAHGKTGLARKTVYDQIFHFQETPGYAPAYALAGMRLAELQHRAVARGASVQDFNTFASSIGFPPRRAFERALAARFGR